MLHRLATNFIKSFLPVTVCAFIIALLGHVKKNTTVSLCLVQTPPTGSASPPRCSAADLCAGLNDVDARRFLYLSICSSLRSTASPSSTGSTRGLRSTRPGTRHRRRRPGASWSRSRCTWAGSRRRRGRSERLCRWDFVCSIQLQVDRSACLAARTDGEAERAG